MSEVAMNARVRLQDLQAALKERGAEDVKFCFSVTAEKPLSQVAAEVGDALEAYLQGSTTPLPALNDIVEP
jgi:hypothetical protein